MLMEMFNINFLFCLGKEMRQRKPENKGKKNVQVKLTRTCLRVGLQKSIYTHLWKGHCKRGY